MKQHPLFQDLSFADMYRLSYFFYKVQLEQGDVLGKEGLYPSFVYFVADGSVRRQEQEKRAWKKTERTMRQGSFPGLASFVSNTPCDATYTVNEDHTTIYVCNPSVLLYFVGGRFLGMPQLLEQLRDPTADATLSFLKETVEGLRFYNTGRLGESHARGLQRHPAGKGTAGRRGRVAGGTRSRAGGIAAACEQGAREGEGAGLPQGGNQLRGKRWREGSSDPAASVDREQSVLGDCSLIHLGGGRNGRCGGVVRRKGCGRRIGSER